MRRSCAEPWPDTNRVEQETQHTRRTHATVWFRHCVRSPVRASRPQPATPASGRRPARPARCAGRRGSSSVRVGPRRCGRSRARIRPSPARRAAAQAGRARSRHARADRGVGRRRAVAPRNERWRAAAWQRSVRRRYLSLVAGRLAPERAGVLVSNAILAGRFYVTPMVRMAILYSARRGSEYVALRWRSTRCAYSATIEPSPTRDARNRRTCRA
jgi:hypothetical protein